ncbi:hypothetical protein [Deinococcus marmoris]|uniref:hypothetical protein n=1 Tax=Deinococcus marmoris TaxID=249408 RepID=UPI0012DCB9B2|nr:hypothetical protein [Deinococcus marmoris]
MPIIMFQNASAWLPVGLLEARCEAAYRASSYPQFEKPSFSFVYGGKTAYVFEASSAKMTVTEFATLSLPSDQWKRVRLACLAGMKGRVKLQPL